MSKVGPSSSVPCMLHLHLSVGNQASMRAVVMHRKMSCSEDPKHYSLTPQDEQQSHHIAVICG